MSTSDVIAPRTGAEREASAALALPPRVARPLMAAIVVAALAAGFAATDSAMTAAAATAAGDDLTRLMRFMAAIKSVMALGAAACLLWRLGMPVAPGRFAAYALAGAAMAAGPGLIWGMAHVALGALLLHGGLVVAVVMLWRDPSVTARLAAMVAARRGRRLSPPPRNAPSGRRAP